MILTYTSLKDFNEQLQACLKQKKKLEDKKILETSAKSKKIKKNQMKIL